MHVRMDIFQIYFLKNTCQLWYSKHAELVSNYKGLSSTNIFCLHYRLQLIQVVIQYRSFFLESHSKMMHLHQGNRSFIYIVRLVRSLVWLSPNELQEQIILQGQYLLSVCSLFTTNLVLYLCTSHFAFFFVL